MTILNEVLQWALLLILLRLDRCTWRTVTLIANLMTEKEDVKDENA